MSDPKKKYHVKEGYRIKHDGETYESGAEMELTEDEAASLHVETGDQRKARLVLAGKASYEPDTPKPNTNVLIEKINAARSAETVEALMSLSTTKAVKAAGDKRLKSLAEAAPKTDESAPDKAELLEKINGAETVEVLEDLADEIMSWKDKTEHEELSNAYNAREKELKG